MFERKPPVKLSTPDTDHHEESAPMPHPAMGVPRPDLAPVDGYPNVFENELCNFIGYSGDRSQRTQAFIHPAAANRAAQMGQWIKPD